MNYYCFKYLHWFLPIIPKIYFNKTNWNWTITFDENCRYYLTPPDDLDWNKLVGISNKFNPRKDSLRIGWRYDCIEDNMELAIYREYNNKMSYYKITTVKLQEPVKINFSKVNDRMVRVDVNGVKKLVSFIPNKLTFDSNLYFGGNNSSPKFMIINKKYK